MFEAIVSGLTLGLILSISVGPVIFAIIRQSLSNGHMGGYAFIAGVSVSDISIVLVCNVLSSIFQKLRIRTSKSFVLLYIVRVLSACLSIPYPNC